jgi:hypothetical protein
MKTLEQIRKEKKEIERRLLFLQHKDRWTSQDHDWYDKTRHEIKKLLESKHNLEQEL